jgi:hypothetical protein
MIKKLSALLIAICLFSAFAFAQVTVKNTSVVFVQNAKASELNVDPKHPGSYTLTLHQPEMYVSFFSDRPKRITGIIPMQRFLSLWAKKNKADFLQDPPNVALESKQSNLIGTLDNPDYNAKTGDITFRFTPLTPVPGSLKLHQNLGYTVLFIDDVSWDPGGFGDGS